MSLVFYGHPESGHSYKVALALSMLDLPHEYRWANVFAPRDQRGADFRAVSPFGGSRSSSSTVFRLRSRTRSCCTSALVPCRFQRYGSEVP